MSILINGLIADPTTHPLILSTVNMILKKQGKHVLNIDEVVDLAKTDPTVKTVLLGLAVFYMVNEQE